MFTAFNVPVRQLQNRPVPPVFGRGQTFVTTTLPPFVQEPFEITAVRTLFNGGNSVRQAEVHWLLCMMSNGMFSASAIVER